MLKGTAISLFGCVLFWNMSKQKYIREFLLKRYSAETINKMAWAFSIFAKGVGAGYYIKAMKGFIKEKRSD